MNPVIRKLLDNINSLAREIEGKNERGNDVNQEVMRSFNRGSESSRPVLNVQSSTSSQANYQPSTSTSSAPKYQLAYNFMKNTKRQKEKQLNKFREPLLKTLFDCVDLSWTKCPGKV